jgi:hypothetical protein
MPETKPTGRGERPSLTPERNLDSAVEGTFPASDPPATTASQGARAVPMEEVLRHADDDGPVPAAAGTVILRHRFPDAEAAKLALEGLVREVPLDRRCAEIEHAEGGAILALRTPGEDASRIEAILRRIASTA